MKILLQLYLLALGVILGVGLSRPWECHSPCCAKPEPVDRCPKCWFPKIGADGVCPACKTRVHAGTKEQELKDYIARSWGDRDESRNLGVDIVCEECRGMFFGHKRRTLCKDCEKIPS